MNQPASSSSAAPAPAAASGRVVLLAGASGLVGRALLQELLADQAVAQVHAVGRRALPTQHAKLAQHQVDFKALPALPRAHEAYVALGTTIKAAGSQEAFRAVDFDAVLAFAQAAMAAGVRRLGVVSAIGASTSSGIFYNRVKGAMEEAVSALPWHTLVIARPSFLAGDRQALGQPVRPGETLALNVSRWLAPLIPANLRSIDAACVARALLAKVPAASGKIVLTSGELRRFQPQTR